MASQGREQVTLNSLKRYQKTIRLLRESCLFVLQLIPMMVGCTRLFMVEGSLMMRGRHIVCMMQWHRQISCFVEKSCHIGFNRRRISSPALEALRHFSQGLRSQIRRLARPLRRTALCYQSMQDRHLTSPCRMAVLTLVFD